MRNRPMVSGWLKNLESFKYWRTKAKGLLLVIDRLVGQQSKITLLQMKSKSLQNNGLLDRASQKALLQTAECPK